MAKGEGIRGRGAGRPNAVDAHVGARVRRQRTLLGMSQERLGDAIGLTFQQVQKYEHGTNRVSASRLYDLSQVLETDMNYFFDEMPEEVASAAISRLRGAKAMPASRPDHDLTSRREALELVRAYYRIRRSDLRKRLFEMTKAMAAMEAHEDLKTAD